jgi:hypothetical protein
MSGGLTGYQASIGFTPDLASRLGVPESRPCIGAKLAAIHDARAIDDLATHT